MNFFNLKDCWVEELTTHSNEPFEKISRRALYGIDELRDLHSNGYAIYSLKEVPRKDENISNRKLQQQSVRSVLTDNILKAFGFKGVTPILQGNTNAYQVLTEVRTPSGGYLDNLVAFLDEGILEGKHPLFAIEDKRPVIPFDSCIEEQILTYCSIPNLGCPLAMAHNGVWCRVYYKMKLIFEERGISKVPYYLQPSFYETVSEYLFKASMDIEKFLYANQNTAYANHGVLEYSAGYIGHWRNKVFY